MAERAMISRWNRASRRTQLGWIMKSTVKQTGMIPKTKRRRAVRQHVLSGSTAIDEAIDETIDASAPVRELARARELADELLPAESKARELMDLNPSPFCSKVAFN